MTGRKLPTFRPVNGRLGWPTGRRTRISESYTGLRLEADPSGPLSITWLDGSIGGLALPRGFAMHKHTLYMLDPVPPPGRPSDSDYVPVQPVRKFDAKKGGFISLAGLGRWGEEARQFRNASNISVTDDALFIADGGNRRIQVVAPGTLHLLHVWPIDGKRATGGAVAGETTELDVASQAGVTYILDRCSARVLRHRTGEDRPETFLDVPTQARDWSRVAVDRDGRVYLVDGGRRLVDVYSALGKWLEQIADAGDVRDRFDPPAITLLFDARTETPDPASGYFLLPAGLAPGSAEGVLFDRWGRRVRAPASERVERKLFLNEGTWISTPLDSGIHACQWHRIAIDLAELPPGSQVVVSTFTSDTPTTRPHEGSPLWQVALKVWGNMQSGKPAPESVTHDQTDALVQSREGQYLWLSVRLVSDGFASPLIRSIEAHFPRDSYVQYLPAIYSGDDESRWFLERLLSIVQTEWDGIEERVRNIARYFDVNATPAEGGWLDVLASWMAVPLEQSWNAVQKRNLLRVASGLAGRRGTKSGLREFVQAYLQNMTDVSPERQGNWPQIVEGYRARRRLVLSSSRQGAIGSGAVLWSASVVGRTQLDVFAEEGSIRLVSTGDPARDLFHQYSHRFTIAVPAAWVRTAGDERLLRRAIEAEKPAHTAYELRLIEPRFRVGIQSTVGIDTLVGDYPTARIEGTCLSAPSRPPRNRLGYDTVLGGQPPQTPRVQIPGSRVGLDTVLN